MTTQAMIQCGKCGWLYCTAEKDGAEVSLDQAMRDSWKPITLECTCGARCTILNGRICEQWPTTGAN
jgi:hypothetical protein